MQIRSFWIRICTYHLIRIRIRIQENGWVGGSATLQRYRYLVHALVLLLVVPGPCAHLLHHVPPPAPLHQPLGREDKKQYPTKTLCFLHRK